MLSWYISVKEVFGFQNLKVSSSDILFQKKPAHVSLILLFWLLDRSEVICENEKHGL